MQVQRIQNNRTSFQARLSIKDAGNCFSLRQKFMLRKFAKTIGNNTDRIFVGTRKYDNIDNSSGKHFKRSDAIVLTLVDNKVVDMRFNQENTFEDIANYIYTFSNEGHNFEIIKPQKVKDKIYELKNEIKEFCSLKRTYHKKSIGDIIKSLFSSAENVKTNTEKSLHVWSNPGTAESRNQRHYRDLLAEVFGS